MTIVGSRTLKNFARGGASWMSLAKPIVTATWSRMLTAQYQRNRLRSHRVRSHCISTSNSDGPGGAAYSSRAGGGTAVLMGSREVADCTGGAQEKPDARRRA